MSDLTVQVVSISFVVALLVAAAGAAMRIRRLHAARHPAAREYNDLPLPALPPDLPAGRVPVWFYQPLDLLGAAFVFLVFVSLALGSADSSRQPAVLTPDGLWVSIGFQFVMAGMVAAFVIRRARPTAWLGLRWTGWPWLLLIAPLSVIGMWVVFGGLQLFGYVEWMESLGVETVQETVKLLQESRDPVIIGLMAFAAVVAAPLCEEVVFRGYFYPVLKRFCGPGAAVISSSLVFACAHGNLTAALPLFLFGGLLVFLYEKTGSLWAPVAAHFCFNSATVIVQLLGRHLGIPLESAP